MSDTPKAPLRVRYAPSPTGYFHIGGARTVLFNWLFARQHNGQFILRIEDTDKERSKPEFEKDILENIAWLGLDWDEGPDQIGKYGPYRESERLDIYEKYLKKLLDEGKAYYCFCAKEQLEDDRQAMLAQGLAPKYSGRCRHLTQEESEKRIAEGDRSVIRFKMPEFEVEFTDLIRGKVKFDTRLIGDVAIARHLRSPLFNFASPIDDALMKVTHVIRGEDLLPTTPLQIMFLRALGFGELKYAHLPILLSPSGKGKMSKRNMEVSLAEYRKNGYLPEALINFAVLLGWHPRDDREVLTKEELIKEFDLKRVQKAGAVFNTQKLDWMNAQYIKRLPVYELALRLREFIPEEWFADKEKLIKAIEAERDRMTKLIEFKDLARFFFELPEYPMDLLIWPRNNQSSETRETAAANVAFAKKTIEAIPEEDFDREKLEAVFMPLAQSRGRGELLWPLRAALSGREASPGPFEIMEAIGKDETVHRLAIAQKKLG
ncbi:glutamate--tRNA ligase [Candidatus Wolfebacteria bacterium]|nr:glutamate--tRNA ligase [Candidatus Wolfebacteria bacterium]